MQINKHNNSIKSIFLIPLIIIFMCIIGYALLVLVYCIPGRLMDKHMRESCNVFEREGVYPKSGGASNSQSDNFTDALMLLEASYPERENIWRDAVNAVRYRNGKKNPVDVLLYIYKDGGKESDITNYARYWHGYLIF